MNIDSVIYKFDMFFDRRADLMAKQKNAEAELNSKGSLYQKMQMIIRIRSIKD